jgi:hypothetical protein
MDTAKSALAYLVAWPLRSGAIPTLGIMGVLGTAGTAGPAGVKLWPGVVDLLPELSTAIPRAISNSLMML